MTLVRSDSHSLYVKVGGYIFRPIHPRGYSHVYPSSTNYSSGDKVNARHKGGTPLANVGAEVWHSHGSYLGFSGESEELYKPSYTSWD